MRGSKRRTVPLLWLGVFSLLVVGPASALSAAASGDARDVRPNVVLITISSLGARHVGCLGYARDTTPQFDAFARGHILFRRAYAVSSWAMPTHGSLFTSRYPSEHGGTHIRKKLGDAHRTLAALLAERGYLCAGFCCNPQLTADAGFAQGFHCYDDFSVRTLLTPLEPNRAGEFDINQRRTNDLITSAATRWLEQNTRQPFFLFVHLYDGHWDYCPPPHAHQYDPNYTGSLDGRRIAREPLYSNRPDARDVEHLVALYDGEVRQTDEDLGRFLESLTRRNLLERSIVVVMGDHGDQFYEHGNTSHHGLYDELIHVPLAISLPGAGGVGRVVDDLVSQIDIMPTVLDCLRLPWAETCRGISVLPLIAGEGEALRPYILAEYTGGAVADCFAIRSTRYKCIQDGTGRVCAFDLSLDSQELQPTSLDASSGECRRLAAVLRRWTETIIEEASQGAP